MSFVPGTYEHYKGCLYTAVGLVHHHETREQMVVYFSHEKGTWNVRPLVGTRCGPDGWTDLVDGRERFRRLDGNVQPDRSLLLPITEAAGDDVWCTCLVCDRPRDGHRELPVEYLVRIRGDGQTRWAGLHARCWEQNSGLEQLAEVLRRRWVPMQEALPERMARVQVMTATGQQRNARRGCDGAWCFDGTNEVVLQCDLTHWRALP
jgi:hypothetical protein